MLRGGISGGISISYSTVKHDTTMTTDSANDDQRVKQVGILTSPDESQVQS